MLFWVALACLTAAVLLALLHPLGRAQGGAAAGGQGEASESEIYRHQLEEIEAERSRGLIGAAEADAARIEISRRLLAAESQRTAMLASPATERRLFVAAVGVAVVVPILTITLYARLGAPHLPDRAETPAIAAAKAQGVARMAEVERLIREREAHLARVPEDGDAWDHIAPVYLRLKRFGDAETAYRHALRLKGDSVLRLAGFAEASVLAANGIVTEPARKAYEKLKVLEPERPEPRFWLAIAKEQDGALAEARADYEALLTAAPKDASWRGFVAERIAGIDARLKDGVAGAGGAAEAARPRALEKGEAAAAEKLNPEERRQMIDGMVAGLAARLERNGRDPAGWQRLIRAYAVLGDVAKARAALVSARRSLADDSGSIKALEQLAADLGLGS